MTFAKYPVTGGGSGSGDVTGPGVSVDNGLVLWNGTGGTSIKDAGVGSANQVLVTDGTTPSWSGNPVVTGITLTDYGTGFKFNDGSANTATIALSGVSGGAQTLTIPTLTAANAGSLFIIDRGSQSFKDLMFFQQGVAVTTSIYMSATLGGNEYTITPTAPAANRIYTLPDAGGNADFVMSAGAQTIGGVKTFSSGVVINPTTNQLVLGVANTTTISSTAPAASRVYTIPDAGGNTEFIMGAGTQTVSGAKTFSTAVTINPTTNQLVLGVTNTVTITSPAPAASRVYTIPDAGGAASFVMTAGTQTIGGTLTLPATVNYTGVGSIVKAGAGALTLSASGAFTLTVPATGTADLIDVAQTVSAIKTHSAAITFTGGTAANASIWFATNVLRQRGGSSGWAVDNTSAAAILTLSDVGAMTAGPTGSVSASLQHVFNTPVANSYNNITANAVNTIRFSGLATGTSVISSRVTSTNTTGLAFVTGTNDTNSAADMIWQVLESDNTDFTTQTSLMYAWYNGSGAAIMSATRAGAVTVGAAASTNTNLILNGSARLENPVDASTRSIAFQRTSRTNAAASLRWTDTSDFRARLEFLINIVNSDSAPAVVGTIANDGSWTVGPVSNSNGTLRVQSNAATASSTTAVIVSQYTVDTDCTGGYFFESRNSSGSTIGRIEAASNTTVAYQTSSDSRLKQNPTSFEGLSKVLQMLPKEYEWKANPGKRDKGFYAQELFEVYPDAVSVGSDELTESGDIKNPWAIDYGRLTPVLVKAIQELYAELQALKAS